MSTKKIGRNAPCPCGSGKKYKHCCMRKGRQHHRASMASSASPRDPRDELRRQLDQIRYMTRQIMHRAPPDEAQEIQQGLEAIEEMTTYMAMHDEIEAATQTLEAHRAEFETLMGDMRAAMDQAQRLFSEERFLPMRYTADDVHRAFEAVGYPQQYREEPHKEEMETLVAATLYLADKDQRLHLARQLLMTLPEYVAAERYLDAWLIQYSAFRMLEAPDKSNPFLFEMFNHGLAEWASQIENQRKALFHKLGLDPSELARMGIEEAEAHLKAQLADPKKKVLLEEYYTAHSMMSDQAKAEMRGLERGALRLLERDDADCLYLSPEEIEPWVPTLLERLKPFVAQARQAAKREEGPDSDIVQTTGDILVEIAEEMTPVIFTSERLDRLLADLKDYRRDLLDAGESEAAAYVHAALSVLESEDTPAENPLLIGICFASLRLMMIPTAGLAAVADTGRVGAALSRDARSDSTVWRR